MLLCSDGVNHLILFELCRLPLLHNLETIRKRVTSCDGHINVNCGLHVCSECVLPFAEHRYVWGRNTLAPYLGRRCSVVGSTQSKRSEGW